MSLKPITKSGFNSLIFLTLPSTNAETIGWFFFASSGLTVYLLIPTILCCSPNRYRISVGSSVRQMILFGPLILNISDYFLNLRLTNSKDAPAASMPNPGSSSEASSVTSVVPKSINSVLSGFSGSAFCSTFSAATV